MELLPSLESILSVHQIQQEQLVDFKDKLKDNG